MNKTITVSLAAALLLGTLAPTVASAATGFADVPDTLPNAPYINELVSKKVLEGVDATRFDPDAPLTREQFAKMVVLAFGLKADAAVEVPFTDVTNEWAKPYVAAAFHNKMIEGASPSQFEPTALLSRQAAASIVWRYLEASGAVAASGETKQDGVVDADQWAQAAVRGVMQHGLRTEGKSSTAYRSQDVMTRGDAAALIALSLKMVDVKMQPNAAAAKPQEQPKKPAVPSGNGESKEQAIYYELSTTAESLAAGKTTYYRLDLESTQSMLFNMENVDRMLIYDDKGQFITNSTSAKFIVDPPRIGTYLLVVEAKPEKHSKFSAFNGMSMEQAINKENLSGMNVSLPANQNVYFSFEALKGSTYRIEPFNPSNELAGLSLYTDKGVLLDKSSDYRLIKLLASESATYYIKASSGNAGTTFGLKVDELGINKETAIAIGAGNTEAVISQNGVTWLQLILPSDKNYELNVEGATSYELLLNSSDPRAKNSNGGTTLPFPFTSGVTTRVDELDPTLFNNYVLRLRGNPGSLVKVTFFDGKTMSGALHLSLDSSSSGKSNSAIIKIGNDRGTFYKVNLEAGKKYEFWPENAMQSDGPAEYNNDTTKMANGTIKTDYITELVMLDANSTELAASKDEKLTFTPTQSGVYYINFKPGMNSRGYYLNAAAK